MTRPVPNLVFVAILTAGLSASTGRAQVPAAPAPAPAPGPATATAAPSPNPLEGWPRPPDEPGSLFRQAPAPMPYACAPLPGQYFERDPLLDPPQFPQPGFVAGVEVQAVVPHIFNQLANGATVGPNAIDSIRVPVSGLNWGVSPRVEAGYRLGSGFGEFLLSYRYLGVTGSSTTPRPDGPASLHSRFDFSVIDLDYASREFTPWEHWGMKWRAGLRMVYLFYDTQLDQSFGLASAGSGILQERAFNDFKGFGGHAGVELDRDLNQYLPGLTAVAKLDFGSTFSGRIKQGVSQTTTAPSFAFGGIDNSQTVPTLAGQFGLSYVPPGSRLNLFVGGLYEYWWNVGRLSSFSVFSRGEMSITGITARLTWNY
ncbi:MAG: hypothetical protein JWO38_2172 [Gemmataceae bacterium]|nr:hypothetical protein [Gemmataceae bacterium]